MEIKTLNRTCIQRNIRTNATTQPRMGNQLPHVLAFNDKESGTRQTIDEFSKAYFPARSQKGTEATNRMMRLLSLGHLSFQI